MTILAFLTDIHANLPALDAALEKINGLSVDEFILGGDSIGIGPYPAETLSRLMNLPNCTYINGNHELVAINGLSSLENEIKKGISEGEKAHTEWYTSQLDETMIKYLKAQSLSATREIEGVVCYFSHIPIDPSRIHSTYPYKIQKLNEDNISQLYSDSPGSLVGFGHVHKKYEVKENNRIFFTPGSLGCYNKSIARFAVIDFNHRNFQIHYHEVDYDDSEIYEDFEKRNVPDRRFIWKTFFGGKLRNKE